MRVRKFLSAKRPVWSGTCLSCGRRRRLYCCVAIDGGGGSSRRTWLELLLMGVAMSETDRRQRRDVYACQDVIETLKLRRGRHAQIFVWTKSAAHGLRPTFYKRSMAYKPIFDTRQLVSKESRKKISRGDYIGAYVNLMVMTY